MLNTVHIRGYRGLRDFSLEPLGLINLIVGNNNSGKTSILEAIQLLVEQDTLSPLSEITRRRNEMIEIPPQTGRAAMTLHDLSHIFSGHQIEEGANLEITGKVDTEITSTEIHAGYVEHGPIVNIDAPDFITLSDVSEWPFQMRIIWNGHERLDAIQTRFSGGFLLSHRSKTLKRFHSSVFIAATGLSETTVIEALEKVVLNADEAFVVDAMRLIEDSILDLRTIGTQRRSIFVRQDGVAGRVPLGSFGDGMRRLLGLALSVVESRGGFLFVDEIDSGLHYTVMEKMWKLVLEASKANHVQVFATTHSRDCIDALASISREGVFEDSEVMIHRIEAGKSKSISYSEATIKAVAEFGNEVR